MTPFDHRCGQTLEIGGARLYVEMQGDTDAPALMLLHGGFGSIADFDDVIPRLAGRHRLIGIDSRGQGRSTLGSGQLSYRRLQHDVEQVADRLALDRYDLIGFSDGGIVALRMAAQPDSRIDRLVVIGADHDLERRDPLRKRYAEITGDSWRHKFPPSFEAYQALNPEPDFDALARAMVAMWLDDSAQGYPKDSVRGIRVPLLVARGDEDPLVSRRKGLDLADGVAGARLLNVPFAGHELHKDQPDLLMLAVNRFLARGVPH